MNMQVPSGNNLGDEDIKLLRLMAQYGFIRWTDNPFTLKSGIKSHVYVFGREDLTDHPDLLLAVGSRIARRVSKITPAGKQACLIGIPIAGFALAASAVMVSALQAPDPASAMCLRIMRQQKKAHGAHHYWVDGRPEPEKHFYITVDNVVTDGGSKFEAAGRLEEDGYLAKEIPQIIFIDRQQGGVKKMQDGGFKQVEVIFNLLDITYVYRQFGLWSPEAVERVETEIRAHQLAA